LNYDAQNHELKKNKKQIKINLRICSTIASRLISQCITNQCQIDSLLHVGQLLQSLGLILPTGLENGYSSANLEVLYYPRYSPNVMPSDFHQIEPSKVATALQQMTM